jgi:type I restriction enzyme M protein
MNMLLHGLPDARIEKGDTIRDPKLVQDGELILYDRVIANPPFSLDEWGIEVAETDGFSRFRFGLPPKTKGDLAFVQHMVATLSVHGQLGVVMPHGVLFRGGSEGKIREGLLREDLVEAVIGLAPNLFYGTGIPAAILVLNRGKPKERKGKVLFVHAAEEMVNGPTQNKLGPENVARIASTFRQFSDEQRFSRVVGNAELAQNEFNLNITRYVDVGTEHERPDVQASLKRLAELTRQRDEAEAKMRRLLEGIGYGPF